MKVHAKMEEFKITHHVGALIQAFGVESVSASGIVELLQKNRTQYGAAKPSSHAALEKLAAQSQNSTSLIQKYEELRSRNFPELNSMIHLLESISSDDHVKKLLMPHCMNGLENGKESNKEKILTVQTIKKRVSTKVDAPDGPCEFPKWVRDRKHFTWDFNGYVDESLSQHRIGPIGALPRETQEELLLNNILFCMQGIDGDYITATSLKEADGNRVFYVDESADPSLLEMSKRIVPLFTDYSTIVSFIEEKLHYQHGLVNHALCEAMRDLLKDYYMLIPQLEQQHLDSQLTLQHLWFYIQPTMIKMRAIADIARAIVKDDSFGGTVLSLLHKRASCLLGDKDGQDMCFHFAQCASLPYFEILEKWLYKGLISDPYSEFFVMDNELAKKEDSPVEYSSNYWEKRYIIRRESVPVFLEKVADMILRTGKYLNVVRQCGHDIKFPHDTALRYVIGEQSYQDSIERAYQFASKKLLDLLMDDNDLRGRLRSVKHYFLLDKGDFFVQFMDMAEEELVKDINDVMPTRLETLLELALRTSAVNSDKYKDDVRIVFLPDLIQSQLFTILNVPSPIVTDTGSAVVNPTTGIEAFAFDYEVKWPLSLVINQVAITSYQILFRHLFSCKHVESLLGRVWILFKKADAFPKDISLSSAFALCQRMLNFFQNMDYYFTLEVIEPHWQFFMCRISQVTNVDEVLECHDHFLNNCIHDCMLAFPNLLEMLSKLIGLCVNFCNFMQEMHRKFSNMKATNTSNSLLAPLYENGAVEGSGDIKFSANQSFSKSISKFHEEFNALFVCLLDMITGVGSTESFKPDKILNMLYRLDFVGYYSRKSLPLPKKESTSKENMINT